MLYLLLVIISILLFMLLYCAFKCNHILFDMELVVGYKNDKE